MASALLFGSSCKDNKKAKPGADVSSSSTSAKKDSRPSDEQMAEIRKKLGEVQATLSTLRGQNFKKDVPAHYQSSDEFAAYVEEEMDREYPKANRQPESIALDLLGLTKKRVDLASALKDAALSQAAAHYDPKTKTFYFLMGDDNMRVLEMVAAHELVHGLQDQHFDLATFGKSASGRLLDDSQWARTFVWEGEATLLMFAYEMMKATGKNPLSDNMKAMEMQVNMVANLDLTSLIAQTKMMSKHTKNLGQDFAKAVDAMDNLPPSIIYPLVAAYMKGQKAVLARYKAGGWQAVDDLYANPPVSTEQMLHAETKLVKATLDLPQKVTFAPATDGWQKVLSGNIGEMFWRVYFQMWEQPKPNKAADGWDGADYVLFQKDDVFVAAVASVWDSEQEASEFAQAWKASIAKRFPKATAADDTWTHGDGTQTAITLDGKRVTIVAKAPKDSMAMWREWIQKATIEPIPGDKVN